MQISEINAFFLNHQGHFKICVLMLFTYSSSKQRKTCYAEEKKKSPINRGP